MDIDFRPMRSWKGPAECGDAPKRWDKRSVDVGVIIHRLAYELEQMDVRDVLIETDHPADDYTIAGRPRSSSTPSTSRVQVWLEFAGVPRVLPAWHFRDWEQNLKAIQMTLERQRQVRDYGVVTVEHQVAGFTALPPGASNGEAKTRPARRIDEGLSLEDAARVLIRHSCATCAPADVIGDGRLRQRLYREAAKVTHPDKVGDDGMWKDVEQANKTLRNYAGRS